MGAAAARAKTGRPIMIKPVTFIQMAIDLAQEKMRAGEGGPFGAVVVRRGEVIGRGWNRVTSANDPTAHAEIVAIRDACAKLGDFSLAGCELYASCEPCPMCLAAIYWARLDHVYYAATREDAAAAGFDDAMIYREIPLSPAERSLPCTHVPCPGAAEVFFVWRRNPGFTRY